LESSVIKGIHFKSTEAYLLTFLRLYVYKYFNYCIYVWSGINEVLINYDRYLVLSNRKNLFNRKHSFKIIIFLTGTFSFLSFVPNLFAYQINSSTNQTDTYYVTKTHFSNTNLYQLYLLFVLTSSNIFSILFLIITSVKLALEAKHFSHNHTANTRQDIKRKQLEMNILKLVLTMNVLFILVRFNDFGYSLLYNLFVLKIFKDVEFLVYYANFWYILVVFVLNSNIFVLFNFNIKFRTIFLNYTTNFFNIKNL
jgi:hypothetical protein